MVNRVLASNFARIRFESSFRDSLNSVFLAVSNHVLLELGLKVLGEKEATAYQKVSNHVLLELGLKRYLSPNQTNILKCFKPSFARIRFERPPPNPQSLSFG